MAQTTLDEWAKNPVDPEIRAHVSSLITALGGMGDDGTYSLGDDALLCLKDLRKWLKFGDGQLNRRDVARCMAEANLVKGDLLEILAKISPRVMEDKWRHKIAVAALELLVPLTWPFEIDPIEATVNHHRHGPYIQLAQIGYKRAILQFDRDRTLQTAVKIALPSMAVPLRERTPRDDGIIRIALYFIRNIAMLSPPSSAPMDIDEAEVSRSATIDTFHEQDIFQVLLSASSSIGEDFVAQDVIILEILFFLLKGIDAEKLFMEDKKLSSKNADELKNLMQKEKAMLAGYARNAPTRHNRFGTMIWVKRDDEKVTTISGQDVLGKAQASMQKMDQTKKWNKPRRPGKKVDGEQEREEFDLPVPLTTSARTHIKAFVEEFLDSSFNPLFLHLRKAIERETERVEIRHSRQYFYLVSWFLRAECARRRTMKERAANPKSAAVLTAEDESYGLVAEVMNQETFILLNRFMQKSQDEKAWQDLNAGMKCFTQILLTVHEMSESGLEDDQEIAENIQNRIFYEESTHERVVMILRSYNGQGFGYLDAVTELSHVFLRMLERYAKQNVDMQIRSKRRARKIKKKAAETQGATGEEDGHVSETEDLQQAQRTVSERKFDFNRFAAKFVNQSSVNTFVAFAKYFADLDTEQLKRAHRFFHRVAFKMELGVLLCRVDILQLFTKMMKGPGGLDAESPAYKEWDDLVKHFFRQVVKRMQERPELVVEMLFSKIPATHFFLEHGYDREVTTRAPRAPAELEVKPGLELPEQIGVAVGVLINQSKSDALQWVRDVLTSAVEERKAWEDAEEARKSLAAAERLEGEELPEDTEAETAKAPTILVKPDSEERRLAMFKDNKLRLLMTLVGWSRLGEAHDPEATWIIPSAFTSTDLQEAIDIVRQYEFAPPTYDDGKGPEDLLRSKASAARRSARRVDFDDDDDNEGINNTEEEDHGEYAADAPTARKPDGERKKLKQRQRARTPVELDDEEKDRRAAARRKKELEKLAKEKSTMFVHDSDDEDDAERDAEFFAREEALRKEMMQAFGKSLVLATVEPAVPKKRKAEESASKSKRRKTPPKRKAPFADSDDETDEDMGDTASVSSNAMSAEARDVLRVESEDEATDTPLSSQHANGMHDSDEDTPMKPTASTATKSQDVTMGDEDDEDEDEDVPVVRRPMARNTRAGFIIDSDSDVSNDYAVLFAHVLFFPSYDVEVAAGGLPGTFCLHFPQLAHLVFVNTTPTDRQKFELIRARWEAAQQSEEEPADMVGRRMSQQPVNGESHTSGGSKFRRTLSHGLAFISNPLSQRKTTPGRQPAHDLTIAVTGATTNASNCQYDAVTSPTRNPTSVERPNADSATTPEALTKHTSPEKSLEFDATPKALPRSSTASLLPRPVRSESSASVGHIERTIKLLPSAVISDTRLHAMPSKIPTPSPPLSERRVSSPRQYLHTSRQEKQITVGHTFTGNSAGSPTKVAVRSRTTPSLVKATNLPRSANYMAPTRAGYKSEATQHPALQENIPTNKRVTQRRSQQQEKPPRRESLAMPPMNTNRRSFVHGAALAHSKQTIQGTSLTEKRSLSSNPSQQTPSTARRDQMKEHVIHSQGLAQITSNDSIAQPRLLGLKYPPTPTPLPTETTRLALPRSNTDKDPQRKTLGTPNGLGGIWRSSRALAATNHEVRRLPRSSTFHNFGTSWQSVPPIPPVPEQYRTTSLSDLFRFKPSHTRMPSNAASCESIPEEEKGLEDHLMEPTTLSHSGSALRKLSDSFDDIVALPHVASQLAGERPLTGSQTSVTRKGNERPWSISDKHYEDSADIESWLQVKDYMPPLYWAGRFQSRYDQWRTEAMMAHLEPQHQTEGQLGKCTLDQDKMAACYVLAQLRDLCLTEQAADSLWVFEYKYRKDNKLLGSPDYPMHPPRKHDDQTTPKGAFGRAVRKLTPRKSSFVNLLKGKSWGKAGEEMSEDMTEQSIETSSHSS